MRKKEKMDRKIYITPDKELSKEMVDKYIENDKDEFVRLNKLYDYYKGEHKINDRKFEDTSKPNNKLVNAFAQYIVDVSSGYFMGIPVSEKSSDEDLQTELDMLSVLNDEQAENMKLASLASIFGKAVEQLWLDNEANIHFTALSPVGKIPIYSTSISHELLYMISYYDYKDIISGDTTRYVDVYDRAYVKHYIKDTNGLRLVDTDRHLWGDVPFVVYENNEELLGDFESTISLIDAYDALESNSINDSDYFSDCYLLLKGLDGTQTEDITSMKSNRVLLLPEGGDANWLIKSSQSESEEAMKTRLAEDIARFSMTPNLSDESFAGNLTGVAIKYKLFGLESKTAKKEKAFRKALQRRLTLLCNMFRVLGRNYDPLSVVIKFTRNIPKNITEMADTMSKVGHLYSEQTQREFIPLEVNEEQEQQRLEADRERGYTLGFEDKE